MNRTQPERFVCGTFRCKQRLSMQNRIFINIFTLIYVKQYMNRRVYSGGADEGSENRDFCFKREALTVNMLW